jgi:uncharacterized lipoprotein YmbA
VKHLAWFVIALALLAGCAAPQPAPRLYQLRAAPPMPVVPVASGQVVQLLAVSLPELLERDALLIPQGQAGLDALTGHRWAEPLRDAVPRVLRQDLAALIGEARVWTAPLPAGVALTRRLRVEIGVLQARPDRGGVWLEARWTLSDATGNAPPRVELTRIEAPAAGTEPDALVAAHRLALWRLAERLAQALR